MIQRDVIAMILVQRAAKNDAHRHATDTQASPADTAAAEVAPEDTEGKVAARQGIRSPGLRHSSPTALTFDGAEQEP